MVYAYPRAKRPAPRACVYQKNRTVSIAVPASVCVADRIFEGTNQLGNPFTEISPLVLFEKGYQGAPYDNPVGCSCHLADLPGVDIPNPTTTGRSTIPLILATAPDTSWETSRRTPVTPVTET